MFNWVKKLFGTESAIQDKYHAAETVVAPKSEKVAPPPAPKAKPAAKKAAPKKAETKTAKHTKASLGKLTKVQISPTARGHLCRQEHVRLCHGQAKSGLAFQEGQDTR